MKPLRIAQISDFHYTEVTWNPFRLLSKRLLGLLNWLLFRKNTFTRDSIDALPPLLKKLAVDRILLGGDLTSTALPQEFDLARKFVQKLPSPWLAIPGNHDHYTYRAYRTRRFYHTFSNKRPAPTHKADFFNLSEHALEAHRLNDHWWVIALDTSRATNPYSSRGLFSHALENRLTELLALIPQNHSILLLSHYPFFHNDTPRHSLERADALEALIRREPRIKAYLQGHSHRHTIANLQPSGLPIILDSGCCASKEKGTWNLLTITDTDIAIDVYRWKKNDWTLDRTETFAWTR